MAQYTTRKAEIDGGTLKPTTREFFSFEVIIHTTLKGIHSRGRVKKKGMGQ